MATQKKTAAKKKAAPVKTAAPAGEEVIAVQKPAAKKAPAKKTAAKKVTKNDGPSKPAPVNKWLEPKPPVVQFKNDAAVAAGTRAREIKRFPLIPVYTTDSSVLNCFSVKSPVNVNLEDNTIEVDSGFLAFGRSVDLLMLSCSQEWHEKQYTSSADTIGDDLKLLSLHARVDGVDTTIALNPQDHPFVKQDEPSTRYLDTVVLFKHGPQEKRCVIQIKGHVDLNNGRIFLNGGSADESVVALGYFLQGNRQRYV